MITTDDYPSLSVPRPSNRSAPVASNTANMTALGPKIRVTGRLSAAEHVLIEGDFEGDIAVPDHGIAVAGSGHVRGEICGRTITVLGRVDGNLTATALIELLPSAVVTGRLASPRLSIEEGATFQGRVDHTKISAAVAVARHRLPQVNATVNDQAST